MNTWKNATLVLTGILLGCGAGAGAHAAFAQNFPPNPAAPKWQQFCEEIDGWPDRWNQRLSSLGGQGWEFTVFIPHNGACFKRPAP